MKKFEYKVERFTTMSSALYALIDLGSKGWEVCAFDNDYHELLLKREIENEQ